MDMRFRLAAARSPSDTLVIVEIDPYEPSKRKKRWPWPRDRYATALANLQDAGANLIAFDVDFSSLSDKAGDAAFAAYLSARPGEVVLPVFSQWSSHTGTERTMVQTPPHDYFLKDSVIASVNLMAEESGIVRLRPVRLWPRMPITGRHSSRDACGHFKNAQRRVLCRLRY